MHSRTPKWFEEIKTLLTEQLFSLLCHVRCVNFWHRRSFITTPQWNKYNKPHFNRLTQAELRLPTLMRECTAIKYTLTEHKFLILGSKHPTVLFTDHKLIIFLFTQKSNPNHRIYRFQLF